MISVTDRIMEIARSERSIGFVGDNKVEVRQFEILDTALFDFNFKLDLSAEDGTKGVVDLDKAVYTDKIILSWDILEEQLTKSGQLKAQLRAFDDDLVQKWHSYEDYFVVADSINAVAAFPSPLPSEFDQMEARVTKAKNEAALAAANLSAHAQTASEQADIATTKAQEAIQSAINAEAAAVIAKLSEDNAKDSEDNASGSEVAAMQALSDLLAMMGTDIATLTGGKLTPSQIPAIAVTDTFVVNSEMAMLALSAQTGDVCIRTDESKSYILQRSDPAILANWQRLQSPTNYADAAGHAATADEATNAGMINNHRLVTMTQPQYDAAVKDPDTIYLVG